MPTLLMLPSHLPISGTLCSNASRLLLTVLLGVCPRLLVNPRLVDEEPLKSDWRLMFAVIILYPEVLVDGVPLL